MIFLRRYKRCITNSYKHVRVNSLDYKYSYVKLGTYVWFSKLYYSRIINNLSYRIDEKYLRNLDFYRLVWCVNEYNDSCGCHIKYDRQGHFDETIISIDVKRDLYVKSNINNINHCQIRISLNKSDIMLLEPFEIPYLDRDQIIQLN